MKTPAFILLLFLMYICAQAQTCTGSLGDPIINYTFGTSVANPGPPLGPGITDMSYSPTMCPNDGEYTIANYTTNCFNAWVTLTDHTGDLNGCYMLVNASIQPSVFYVDTIDNLCGNVTYQFGAWVVNVVSGPGYIEPNLTFTIRSLSGTVLQSNNTGNIPITGGQWNYYSFNFTTSGTTSVILSITNNAPGGGGNDLAIDDISLRSVGPGIDLGILGYPADTVSFCNTIPPLTLTAQVDSCYPVTVYQWQFSPDSGNTWTDIAGATGLTYAPSVSAAGAYIYRMAAAGPGNINNVQCRVLSSMLAVYCNPGPSLLVNPEDTTVCPGSDVVFTASGANAYQWSDLTQGTQKAVTVTSSSFYIVSASNTGSACVSIDTVYVNVFVSAIPVITQQATGPCIGDTVFLSATGGVAYLWSTGESSAVITIFPVSDSTYMVTAADANGCTGTASSVTVASVAGPLLQISPKDTTVCPGNGVLFTASGAGSYQWSDLTQGAQNLVTVTASSIYIVSASDPGIGCVSVDTAYADVFIPITPIITQQTIGSCAQDTVLLSATGGVTYLWTNGETSANLSIQPVTNATYTVTSTDANGCSATASSVTVASATWSISPAIVEPPCPFRNTGTIDLIASGDTGQLYYLWSTGDTSANLGSLGPGNYSVIVSDSAGCQTPFTFTIAYSYTLQVSISPGDTSLPIGAALTLQTICNVNNGNQYTWSPVQNLSCSGCPATIVHLQDDSSTYIVNVIDQNGCVATDTAHIRTYEMPPIPYLFIPDVFTPNGDGTNDFFQIFGPGAALDSLRIFSVKIFDRWGERVYESLDPAFKWNGTYKGADMPPAVYVYLIDYLFAGKALAQHSKGSLTLVR